MTPAAANRKDSSSPRRPCATRPRTSTKAAIQNSTPAKLKPNAPIRLTVKPTKSTPASGVKGIAEGRPADSAPVAIVGSGLAGLKCALELQVRGIDFTIYEASDGVGGRAGTDSLEGFSLDRVSRSCSPPTPKLSRPSTTTPWTSAPSCRARRFASRIPSPPSPIPALTSLGPRVGGFTRR